MGYKIWAICTPDGYLVEFEPAVIGKKEPAPKAALLELCRSLPHKNYRMYADNLFVNMATITECYNLTQRVYLSGTVMKNYCEFPKLLLEHAIKGKKNLFLRHGDYEAMYTCGPPKVVAVVWCDSEKQNF